MKMNSMVSKAEVSRGLGPVFCLMLAASSVLAQVAPAPHPSPGPVPAASLLPPMPPPPPPDVQVLTRCAPGN
jgi:hypothetical protein